MRMHVNKTKAIAMLGVMAALSTVLTVLGTVISVNTVFFTAAAAFLTGIAVCQYGIGYGIVYFFVCLVLDFIVNPNKFHVLLYIALAGYILLSEITWKLLHKMAEGKKKENVHRVIRFVIFEVVYNPILFLFPALLVSDRMRTQTWFYYVMVPAGIVAWVIYDMAYAAAKKVLHKKFRKIF